jgi:predicted ATPase
MLISLGVSLNVTKGFGAPEVEQTFLRAQHLCEHLEAPHQFYPALRGLWNHYLIRAELQRAEALGEQLLSWAQHAQNLVRLVAARSCLGMTFMYLGAVTSAHTHFLQSLALYDPQRHRAATFLYGGNAGVTCHSFSSWTLWFLGYPDQGLAQSQQAVTLAQQIAHPFCLAEALFFAAMLHQFRREVRAAQERTEASILLFQEQGFPLWRAIGPLMRGWALAHQGQAQEGIAQITQGLRAFRATGVEIGRPWRLATLAEAYSIMGQPEAGLTALAEALILADTTGERWCEPELYRYKGELLLQQSSDNQADAETCFHHALEIARTQQAKSFELRTATSLARLWQQQGKRQEAYDLLAPVYGWFTEGFDTADLKDAKALLDELSESRA